jgi:hypothetical protein
MNMKKLACLVSALTLMGVASSGFAQANSIIKDMGTVAEDAMTFVAEQVHDVTDYYFVEDVDGVADFEQYLAQDPGGKIRGTAFWLFDNDEDAYIQFSVSGSISGGASIKGKPALVKLTYKAISSNLTGVGAGGECTVGPCVIIPVGGSVKGTFTVTTCSIGGGPCEPPPGEADVVRLEGTLSGSVKIGKDTAKINENVAFYGESDRGENLCKAFLDIDIYPTSMKYNCDTLLSMKYDIIGYVTFDSGIRDIVTGSGSWDAVKGFKFSVSSCYGKLTVTSWVTQECDVCYTGYKLTGKIGGQTVESYGDLADGDFTWWDNLVYGPAGLLE